MDGALDVLLEGNDDLLLPRERGVDILFHAPVLLIAVEGVADVRAAEEELILVACMATLPIDIRELLHEGMAYALLLHALDVVEVGGDEGIRAGEERITLAADRGDVCGAPCEEGVAAFGEGGRGGNPQAGDCGGFLLHEDVLHGEFLQDVEDVFPIGREVGRLPDDFEGEVLAAPHALAHLRERRLREMGIVRGGEILVGLFYHGCDHTTARTNGKWMRQEVA